MEKPIIYFLCTGNSCRSQMAEGFGHQYLSDRFTVLSAGIEAHGLNGMAVRAMKEIGIDISHHESKLIDPIILNKARYVITLCGDAEDRCPITPSHVERLHWPFKDPARAEGTPEAVWAVYQSVRDQIGQKIRQFSEALKIG